MIKNCNIYLAQFRIPLDHHCLLEECVFTLQFIQLLVIITMTDARNITYGRQKGSANQWWRPFGSSGEHMRQHLCRNTHNLLHGCSHRCPPGSSYRTMWHLPIEHEKPLNTETLSHSHVHFDSMWMWALMFVIVQRWSTYHRVADLEHLTEQNPTLSFCKGLSKRIQIAGVPYIGTVHTLWDMHTQADTVILQCLICSYRHIWDIQ